MRISVTLLILLLFLNGCSKMTAFDYFGMESEEKAVISHLQTATLVYKQRAKVILSAVYLNAAFPQKYADSKEELFLVSMVLEDVKYNKNPSNLTLNGQQPTSINDVQCDDPLRSYLPVNNEWTSYYLVGFSQVTKDEDSLLLTFESGQFGSVVLTYLKDEL
jgi:hypothetical protein